MFLMISKRCNNKGRKIFIIMSAAILLIFSTFRGSILGGIYKGNDYDSYQNWFFTIENVKISLTNDVLFNLLMLCAYKLTGCFEVFVFITSLISIYGIYKFAIDNSKNYTLLIYYFITFGMYELGLSAIRQFLAISIFLMSFKFIHEKKFLKYLIGIIIASMFHSSAAILIFIYPFIRNPRAQRPRQQIRPSKKAPSFESAFFDKFLIKISLRTVPAWCLQPLQYR